MRRRPLVPGSWSLVALLLLACSSRPKADFVLFGKIWTGDSSLPYAQALAVAHDSILGGARPRAPTGRIAGRGPVARAGRCRSARSGAGRRLPAGRLRAGRRPARADAPPGRGCVRCARWGRSSPRRCAPT